MRRVVRGPGADAPLVLIQSDGARRYHHADERGFIVGIGDEGGGLVAATGYDEYGNAQSPISWFGDTGQLWTCVSCRKGGTRQNVS